MVVAAGLLACGGPRAAPTAFRRLDPSVLLDPDLVWVGPGTSATSFDGGPSSLRGGPGWYFPEPAGPGPWKSAAWAARNSARYFEWLGDDDLELVLRCAPFSYPGSPPQIVRPQVNGLELPAQTLPDDWSELRFRVPRQARRARLNTLELHFDHATEPMKVLHSDDFRSLAAACGDIRLGPPGLPAGTPTTAGPFEIAPRKTALRLAATPLGLPLPPAASFRIRLGRVVQAPADARIQADLLSANGERQAIWSGPARDAGAESQRVPADGAEAPRLLLAATSSTSGATTVVEAPVVEAQASSPPRRPDIFLYVIDTLRRDEVGAYGQSLPLTPHLDSFARQAITFDRAWSTSAWTAPATVSLLSGLMPSQHGTTGTVLAIAADLRPWLPEVLRGAGYETIGISQWLLATSVYGIDRGFDSFFFDTALLGKRYSDTARWYVARELLDRADRGPRFFYIHVADPHAPYRPEGEDLRFARERPGRLPPAAYDPLEFQRRGLAGNHAEVEHLRALYDGEVERADRGFGAFLDLLRFAGVYDDSVIVVTADHGEEFAEHGGFDHGRTLYEELVHIPLLVKLPGGRGGGGRSPEPVSLVDIAPTLAALAGARPAAFPGQLLPLPGAPAAASPGTRPLLAELSVGDSPDLGAVTLQALLQGDVKCVRNPSRIDRFRAPAPEIEAYDLGRDPGERLPLPASDPRRAACVEELERQFAELRRPAAAPRQQPLSPEDALHLRSLGYIQ